MPQVCLWLGANVMLEYPRDEAILLLEDNLKNAKAALVTLVDDMGHLRDQITVTEVNMARVFNWDVKVSTATHPRTLVGVRCWVLGVDVDAGGMARRERGEGWGCGEADRQCLCGACPWPPCGLLCAWVREGVA